MDINISISWRKKKIFPQIHLDIKYATDPEIKLPIVVLPAFEGPAVEKPPTSAAFGFEAFGNPNQPTWSLTPQQHQATLQPMDPPPHYGAHAMYPPFTDPDKEKSAMWTPAFSLHLPSLNITGTTSLLHPGSKNYKSEARSIVNIVYFMDVFILFDVHGKIIHNIFK